MTTQLISNTAQPIISSYMEFDENDKSFKVFSGSFIDSAIQSHDL